MKDCIFLDNITTARVSDTAIAAMMPFFDGYYGSPVMPHEMGQNLLPYLEKSYRAIYSLFSAKESDQFVFTSSNAEAISQVMHSVYYTVSRKTGKTHFVTSSIEDAASVLAISKLQEEGCTFEMAKVGSGGHVTLDTISEAITPRTCLISISLVCALTGVVQPIAEIVELCKLRAILLHVDVTHAVGKLFVDIDELGANFVTFNGEQFHAPKGTGGLFCRGASLLPLISGEDEEKRLRGGPLNVPALIGLGQAAIEAESNKNLYCTEVARLRDKFEQQLNESYPEAHIFFKDQERAPHITTIAFPGIRNEALLYALSRKKLFANIGGGPFQQIERVLEEAGIDHVTAQCALSFSLSKETQEDEVDRAVTIITDAAKRLRRLSKVLL
ncbi:MAG: iscS [Chlamydiia bacterium]|nr:iscS [Chlamydiia bacterium]